MRTKVNQLIHTLVSLWDGRCPHQQCRHRPRSRQPRLCDQSGTLWHHDEAATRRYFEINSIAPYLLARALVAGMIERRWGRIVNVTTSLGSMMRGGMAGYGGSKAGLESQYGHHGGRSGGNRALPPMFSFQAGLPTRR